MVLQHEPPFKRSFKTLGRLYSTIFTRNFLTRTAYQEKSPEELKAEIERRWKEFLEHDLPKLDAVLRGEAWLWGKSDL